MVNSEFRICQVANAETKHFVFRVCFVKACLPFFEVYLLRAAEFGHHHRIRHQILHRYNVPTFYLKPPDSRCSPMAGLWPLSGKSGVGIIKYHYIVDSNWSDEIKMCKSRKIGCPAFQNSRAYLSTLSEREMRASNGSMVISRVSLEKNLISRSLVPYERSNQNMNIFHWQNYYCTPIMFFCNLL